MNPYSTVDDIGFWRPAVADRNMFNISDLWTPKFPITPRMKVSTYGSCFAQYIGRALRDRGFGWFLAEPRPFGLSDSAATTFNFDVFSSRTGNIYTPTLLLQWLRWAFGISTPSDEIWERNGRYYDPFRPNIEPDGFLSEEEVLTSRQNTLKAFQRSVVEADIFVFTLGLTERWTNTSGYEYPMCPGTVAGSYSDEVHEFSNLSYSEANKALREAISIMRKANPRIQIILTVSPVPLTATYSGKHVLVATMHSKSTLRAVAGHLADRLNYVDYFPSYEIINSPVFKGAFFEPNMRSVVSHGVDFVMESFFEGQIKAFGNKTPTPKADKSSKEDIVCEEELLQKFENI